MQRIAFVYGLTGQGAERWLQRAGEAPEESNNSCREREHEHGGYARSQLWGGGAGITAFD